MTDQQLTDLVALADAGELDAERRLTDTAEQVSAETANPVVADVSGTVRRLSRITDLWKAAMGRSEVEMNTLAIFLIVADAQGSAIPQSAVRDAVGLSEAATSRNIAMLSTGATPTSLSPKLIESYEDPEYRRRKLVRMTAKGTQLLESMQAVLRK